MSSEAFRLTPSSTTADPVGLRALARAWLVQNCRDGWRRHGIGLLQRYVAEGSGSEVRLHIWHPDLIRPGIAQHGDAHDHRFDLCSTVLHGTLVHEHLVVASRPPFEPAVVYDVHQVLHARINPEGAFAEEPMRCVPGPLSPKAKRVEVHPLRYEMQAGTTYRFPRGEFHRSIPHGLVVTLVTKTNQIDAGARILALPGSPPVPAFSPADADDENLQRVVSRVLRDAIDALE